MPRDSENQRTARRDADATTERDPDLEAEHRADAARRASLIGLRRRATTTEKRAVAPATDVTPAQQRQQHDKADAASFRGLQAAMALGAKQLQDAADDVLRLVASPAGEAGAEPQMQAARARIQQARRDLHLLNTHISSASPEHATGMTSAYRELYPELGAINGAFARLEAAIARATQLAIQHGDRLGVERDVVAIRGDLDDMHGKLGAQRAEIRDRPVDDRPEAAMHAEAVGANITAALEAVRSVRMAMSGDAQVVSGDLRKVIRHVGEVATLVNQIANPKALKPFQRDGAQLLEQARGLEREVESQPELAHRLASSEFRRYLGDLESRFGGRR